MYCKYCGKQIADDAKFCDGCGKSITDVISAPVQNVSEPTIYDKKKKKRGPIGCFLWGIIILFVLGSCSAILGNSNTPATKNTLKDLTQENQLSEKQEKDHYSYIEIASRLETELKDNFQYCDFSYDETGLTASLSMDGIADICYFAKTGNKELEETWNIVIDSTVELSKTVTDTFRKNGYNDYVVSFIITNEKNADDILAMTVDGVLVYDATLK